MLINSTDLSIASIFSEKDKLLEGWKSFQDQSALGGIAQGLGARKHLSSNRTRVCTTDSKQWIHILSMLSSKIHNTLNG